MDKILLIDALNFIHRANIGFPSKKKDPIKTSAEISYEQEINQQFQSWAWENGIELNAFPDLKNTPTIDLKKNTEDFVLIFNFFRNLRPLIEQFSPDKCFFVLEGYPKFRYDLYSSYKEDRIIKYAKVDKEKNDKFHRSKDEIIRILQYFPITIAKAKDYEADDTVATLCENMKDEDLTVVSNDSDYIQLLQRGYSNCKIYNPMKKTFMESPTFPYIAWKSLNGDKSDSIPALLTPKKALNTVNNPELFKQFMLVEENRANFNINRQLIEFAQVPLEEINLQEGIRNFDEVKKEFEYMEFESIINPNSWKKYTSTFDCLKF